MRGEKNACVESICAETNCTTILNENGGPSICCDVCEDLFCTKCVGITKRNYELISGCKNIKMVCNGCLSFTFTSMCQKKMEENSLSAKVEELESKFDSIKSIGDIIAKDSNETMTYSKVLKESLEEYQTNEVDKSIADNPLSNGTAIEKVSVIISNKIKQDRDDKEKNDEMERAIIVNGICEDNIKNYDKRVASDMEKVKNMITDGMKIQMPIIEKIQRLGRYNPDKATYRPIRIIFKERSDRNKMVRNASNLKEADEKYKKCYINKELNSEERKEYEETLNKAKEMTKKDETNGKFFVVRGHPTKWRIVERDLKQNI